MNFAEYLQEYIKEEGYSQQEVWEMSLSQYNKLKKEAREYYKKEYPNNHH